MIGKIKKKLLEPKSFAFQTGSLICPICDRFIPVSQKDAHHLVPRSKGGRSTEFLHKICHKQIHALFNENELAKTFNTAESLKSDPDMQIFIHWVKNKPDAFYERVVKSSRIKK